MPTTFSRSRIRKIQQRKYLAALVRYFYTGEWDIPHSPVVPTPRLSWPATTSRFLILAKH
jgi:hypothetical protein